VRTSARFVVVTLLACCGVLVPPFPSAHADPCSALHPIAACEVTAGPDGYFHGVIGLAGQGWVLDASAHDGAEPGCGDCAWSLVLDCPHSDPEDPGSSAGCAGLGGGYTCPPDRIPYRLYLTSSQVTDQLVGTVCLGGTSQVVTVGITAASDVERYLHDLTPPDLVIVRRPPGPTLAGLATFLTALPPSARPGPIAFGGPAISEAITVHPVRVRWLWGDGASSGWQTVDATATHRYLAAGSDDAMLIAEWSASYDVTFDGRTVGPFDARGQVQRSQHFTEQVTASNPVLVSGAA
jgi:hypothetical protein